VAVTETCFKVSRAAGITFVMVQALVIQLNTAVRYERPTAVVPLLVRNRPESSWSGTHCF